jgi:TolA-binding protein
MKKLPEYLEKYPQGSFRADASYRLMVCKYAASLFDEVIEDSLKWRADFPNHPMEGEVLALLGDSLAAQDKISDAIPVYIESYKKATSDEVLNYSLFEASKHMQKMGDWPGISAMFEEFVKDKPDHPTVVAAMYWIGKAKAREGKTEEAKQFLVEQLKRYIDDPKREAVEQLIDQLVQLCSKRPRGESPVAVAPSPSPVLKTGSNTVAAEATPPPYDSEGELDKQIAPLATGTSNTTKARLLYAKAELAQLRKKPEDREKYFRQIADQFKPEDQSPTLLAQVGDYLLSKGDSERAAKYYTELKEYYPNSAYLDFAYVEPVYRGCG